MCLQGSPVASLSVLAISSSCDWAWPWEPGERFHRCLRPGFPILFLVDVRFISSARRAGEPSTPPSPPEPRIQNPADVYRSAIGGHRPVSALAPMQAVSSLEYWQVMHRRGGPDLYFTEYFRVHSTSRLDRFILRSIDENETGKPVIAQMIGNDIPCLVATAKELAHHPIAGIDLNLGCPAPIVYKNAPVAGFTRA